MEEQKLLQAQENLLCQIILDYAKAFYNNPEKLRAYEEWRKNKIPF